MNNKLQMVTNFMVMARQEIPNKPTVPSWHVMKLRHTLIEEELEELEQHTISPYRSSVNLVEVADDLADLLYVIYGAAVAFGIDIEPIFEEVHNSNMSKFIDGTFREDGKYVKGPSYKKPNLEPLIEKQIKAPSSTSPD